MLPIEILYIGEDQTVCHVCIKVLTGTVVSQAIELSGIKSHYPELQAFNYAIFGQNVASNTVLKEGDRIEILRPLKIDPMTKRRLRAQKS